MVASHFLKWCHFKEDSEGEDLELRYFRDVDLREVDFAVVKNKKPYMFIECKTKDRPVSTGLLYLTERFKEAKAYQISLAGKENYTGKNNVRVCPAVEFLGGLV